MCKQAPSIVRSTALVLLLLAGSSSAAQNAFNDSLTQVAVRITTQLLDADKHRVAVIEIMDPGGTLSKSLITYVEETLISRLVQVRGITVVERSQLDQVMEEQRRTASGVFDEGSAIELGRLLAADAIITGRLFPVDRRIHVMLRVLDTETGVLLGTSETFTAFPAGQDPRRADKSPTPQPSGPQRMKRDNPGTERASIIEMRGHALGALHFGRPIPGGALEIAVRGREDSGDKLVPGKASIGFQASFWPRVGEWRELDYDVGRIADIQATADYFGTPTVRFGGLNMVNGSLFLMSKDEEQVTLDEVLGTNDEGIVRLEYDRNRLSNIRMDMVGFNVPLRWYLGENHIYDNVPKLYMELGFGMDLVLVRADYEVTSTVLELDRSDYSYLLRQETFMDDKPSIGSMGSNILFTHFSVGGGLELGRFNLFALGRFLSSSSFAQVGRDFDRLRGNIVAYPVLAGAGDDQRALSDLERDGALPYGALDLERERSSDPSGSGTPTTIKGNGVDRFWQSRYLTIGLSFRFW